MELNGVKETRILIVGAGPTGLTLALDLARRGVDFRIVDQAGPQAGSRGKGLQPRTLEVFDDLGIIDEVLAGGAPYPMVRAYQGDTVVWEGHMHEERSPTPDVPYPNLIMIPQSRTVEILRGRLDRPVEYGTRLAAFDQDDHGVTAVLDRGGVTERVRAAYLVAADGGRGETRSALGVGFAGQTREEERMILGDVVAEGVDREHIHVWMDGENMSAALYPMPGTGTFQLMAPIAPDTEPELTTEAYQKILPPHVQVRETRWTSRYRVNIRLAERYRSGRVFLAGDAAHVHSPAGGQGLNTGVQDAYNLGWKLAAVLAGAPAELLDTYEAERLPVAADMLGITTHLHDSRSLTRGSETDQLAIGYTDGPLAFGPASGGRAPDAPLDGPSGTAVRLFDLFRGPHFTVLAFGGPAPAAGPGIRSYSIAATGQQGDLIDVDGHAHKAYEVDTPVQVLIRPDGYIAARGADVLPHLPAILG